MYHYNSDSETPTEEKHGWCQPIGVTQHHVCFGAPRVQLTHENSAGVQRHHPWLHKTLNKPPLMAVEELQRNVIKCFFCLCAFLQICYGLLSERNLKKGGVWSILVQLSPMISPKYSENFPPTPNCKLLGNQEFTWALCFQSQIPQSFQTTESVCVRMHTAPGVLSCCLTKKRCWKLNKPFCKFGRYLAHQDLKYKYEMEHNRLQ